jgi:hypothetical protein
VAHQRNQTGMRWRKINGMAFGRHERAYGENLTAKAKYGNQIWRKPTAAEAEEGRKAESACVAKNGCGNQCGVKSEISSI